MSPNFIRSGAYTHNVESANVALKYHYTLRGSTCGDTTWCDGCLTWWLLSEYLVRVSSYLLLIGVISSSVFFCTGHFHILPTPTARLNAAKQKEKGRTKAQHGKKRNACTWSAKPVTSCLAMQPFRRAIAYLADVRLLWCLIKTCQR